MTKRSAIIGIDPGIDRTGLCLMDAETGKVVAVRCSKPKLKKGCNRVLESIKQSRGVIRQFLQETYEPNVIAIGVEGQEVVSSASRGVAPTSILKLGQLAGAYVVEASYETENLFYPEAREWKGSVPKQTHQARILASIGWDYELVGTQKAGYARPTSVPNVLDTGDDRVNKSDWKEIVDAIGIAKWIRKQVIACQ